MDPKLHLSAFCFIASQVSGDDEAVTINLPSVLWEAKSASAQLSSFMQTSVMASLAFDQCLKKNTQKNHKPQSKVLIAAGSNGSLDVWLLAALTYSRGDAIDAIIRRDDL